MTEFTFGKWYPIETAPKDGTEILSYRDARLISVVAWGGAIHEWVISDGPYVIGITHWMPLPPPPIGESN